MLSGGAGGVIKEWKWNQDFELKFSKEWCVAQRFVPATQRLSFEAAYLAKTGSGLARKVNETAELFVGKWTGI